MALLFYDGFEGIDRAQIQAGQRYNAAAAGANYLISNTHNPVAPGEYAVRQSGAGPVLVVRKDVTAHATGVVGARFLFGNTGQSLLLSQLFNLEDSSGVDHLTVLQKADGEIEVRRGSNSGTILGTSTTAGLATGVWTYVECKYTIDDTNGGVEVRVNGTAVLKLGIYADTPTTLDTRNAGTASIARVWFGLPNNTSTTGGGVDDVYIVDSTGSSPYNDFLGDVRVVEMLPSAAGDSADFTPNAGANWDRVDDALLHDGDTTYVESSTAGHKDLYTTVDPDSDATTIYAAKVVAVARKTDAGDQALEFGVKSTSTESFGTAQNLADAYAEYTETFLTDPATSAAWTIAGLDATQVGFRIPV